RIAEVSDAPYVEVELVDGSRFTISSIEPEPGYGFVTLSPTRADGPAALIVPLGSIRRIEVSRSEEERSQPGFAVSGAAGSAPGARSSTRRSVSRPGVACSFSRTRATTRQCGRIQPQEASPNSS